MRGGATINWLGLAVVPAACSSWGADGRLDIVTFDYMPAPSPSLLSLPR